MKFRKITRLPRKFLWAVVLEGVDAGRMMNTYARHGTGKLRLTPAHRHPTEEELKEAAEQLKNTTRFLPFFVAAIIPVPGIVQGYVLVMISLERYLGDNIKLLPTRFRNLFKPDTEIDDN